MKDFIKNASSLAKNPLGIIALFVSLIYGFVCLVFSFGLSKLYGASERMPLIWFMILFPVIILACFIFLVVTNHQKLYAPGDYKDESNFFNGFSKLESARVITNNEETNIKSENTLSIDGILDAGSIKGIFALYAVKLAFDNKVVFKISDLETYSDLLSHDYTFGYLISCGSAGVFTKSEDKKSWVITSLNEDFSNRITEKCKLIAKEYEDHPEDAEEGYPPSYLNDQLKNIEEAFLGVKTLMPKASTTTS